MHWDWKTTHGYWLTPASVFPFSKGHMAHGGGDVILLWELAPVFSNADPNFFLSMELEQRMRVTAKQLCSYPPHPALVWSVDAKLIELDVLLDVPVESCWLLRGRKWSRFSPTEPTALLQNSSSHNFLVEVQWKRWGAAGGRDRQNCDLLLP